MLSVVHLSDWFKREFIQPTPSFRIGEAVRLHRRSQFLCRRDKIIPCNRCRVFAISSQTIAPHGITSSTLAGSGPPIRLRRMGRPGSGTDRALYEKKRATEIVGQLFNFTDKGEREVAMRPELTPTLARVVAAHDREFKKPLKWFSIPQCFRYEKQQRGRLREHYQLNATSSARNRSRRMSN